MFCFYPLESFGKVSKIVAQLKKVFSLKIYPHLPVAQKIIETNQMSAIIFSSKLVIKLENEQIVKFSNVYHSFNMIVIRKEVNKNLLFLNDLQLLCPTKSCFNRCVRENGTFLHSKDIQFKSNCL